MQWSLLWILQCGRLILWAEKKVSWQGEPANPKPSNAHQPPPPAPALCGLKPAMPYASSSPDMKTLPTIYISTVSSSFFIQPHGAGNRHFSVKQMIFLSSCCFLCCSEVLPALGSLELLHFNLWCFQKFKNLKVLLWLFKGKEKTEVELLLPRVVMKARLGDSALHMPTGKGGKYYWCQTVS